MNIDETIEFILSNSNGQYSKLPAEDFITAIKKHEEYGTFMTVRDDKGIVGLVRWNWVGDDTLHVLDCIVRKDMRSIRIIKYLTTLGFSKNPTAKYLTYDRLFKYPDRKTRRLKIGGLDGR
jgi:hypothetical protein